jgi:hypothetical protein
MLGLRAIQVAGRGGWDALPGTNAGLGPVVARRSGRGCFTPDAAVRAMPARVLLSCLLVRSSWLTVEGDRHFGAAGVLHRRGGRAAVAVRVGVAHSVATQQSRRLKSCHSTLLGLARSGSTTQDCSCGLTGQALVVGCYAIPPISTAAPRRGARLPGRQRGSRKRRGCGGLQLSLRSPPARSVRACLHRAVPWAATT